MADMHTPGPWRWIRHDYDGNVIKHGNLNVLVGPNGQTIIDGKSAGILNDDDRPLIAKAWLLPELIEALRDAGAHLIGATSAYKTFAAQIDNMKPDPDALFKTRLSDYEKACERVRAALKQYEDQS